jgi:SAM-dependent methyltransferase
MLTWIPGVQRAFFDPTAGGGTGSASYCYGVWIKHLALAWASGMREVPRTVVELGPGSSIGTGVATLLSGAQRYVAIDAVPHMRAEANVAVLRDLVRMFRERAPRPKAGFPPFDHLLDERLFPGTILDDARLESALAPARIACIERAMRAVPSDDPDPLLEYHTWSTLRPVADGTADFVFSHVVMNHVDDLADVYGRCGRWLAPGGWMSHQIDFTSLGTADEWNGHRAYSELAWKIIAGRRPYFVNREPLATHLAAIDAAGFEVVRLIRGYREGGISRGELAPRWRGLSDEDLRTQTGFIVARKRRH